MSHLPANIAAGRVAELYNRVKSGDPANSRFVVIPLETTGLVSDQLLADYDTVADMLAGATNEQTTLGRKVLAAADLAAIPAPDDANNRNDRSLPAVSWTGTAGNAVSKFCVAYIPNFGTSTDADMVPCTYFDQPFTPDGTTFTLDAGVFFRATGLAP